MDYLHTQSGNFRVIYSSFPHAQYEAHKDHIKTAIQRVLDSGLYILGPEVEAFEASFSDYIGCGYGVGVNSGTDALTLTLTALGVGPGDEVITVSHTAVATVTAITNAGATPVLVDIEPDCYTMNPTAFENAITAHTKAVVIVHLYGQAADLDRILPIARKHNLKIIEDCAQVAGARLNGQRLGSFADVACFSFYPTKNLGAIGDGGLVATDDAKLAAKVRQLREYGWNENRISQVPGCNSRLDELQAAILNAKLNFLDEDNAARRKHAARYDEILLNADLKPPCRRKNAEHIYHLYVLEIDDREDFMTQLSNVGIRPAIHYPAPAHQQTAYAQLQTPGGMAVTDDAVKRILTLPMYPELPNCVFTKLQTAIEAWGQR